MQLKKISTVEQLQNFLKENLSEKRYNHVVAVAETTEMVLNHYNCTNYTETWNNMKAGIFCGLAHDIAREVDSENLIEICRIHNVELCDEERKFPVLLHSHVSSIFINEMFGNVPESWLRAISLHTLGDKDMDDLALALFIADYIEPGRTYLTDERRQNYLRCKTIQQCAYSVLCDIIKHLEQKGSSVSTKNLRMKEYLENK